MSIAEWIGAIGTLLTLLLGMAVATKDQRSWFLSAAFNIYLAGSALWNCYNVYVFTVASGQPSRAEIVMAVCSIGIVFVCALILLLELCTRFRRRV